MKRITVTEAQLDTIQPQHLMVITTDEASDTTMVTGVDIIAEAQAVYKQDMFAADADSVDIMSLDSFITSEGNPDYSPTLSAAYRWYLDKDRFHDSIPHRHWITNADTVAFVDGELVEVIVLNP